MLDQDKIEKLSLELARKLDEYGGGEGEVTKGERLNQMVALRMLYRAMEIQVGPMFSAIAETTYQLMEAAAACGCPDCTERRAETQRREVENFVEQTHRSPEGFEELYEELYKAGFVSKKGEA